jgi:rhodanese-related sulfurtransferase
MSQPQTVHNGLEIIEQKQTVLGLYVTANEAYEMWKADPEKVKILDVRTLEEYIFVGHPEMACNIPLAMQTHQWDDEKKMFAVKPNPDFEELLNHWADPSDNILVICRSGGRSAMAVNILAKVGFKNTYNIIDGMEGDLVKDPGNLYHGKRMKNGWKNSGLPWTYEINPDQVIKKK